MVDIIPMLDPIPRLEMKAAAASVAEVGEAGEHLQHDDHPHHHHRRKMMVQAVPVVTPNGTRKEAPTIGGQMVVSVNTEYRALVRLRLRCGAELSTVTHCHRLSCSAILLSPCLVLPLFVCHPPD